MPRIYGRKETLRNYAMGLSQDVEKNSLANFIAPRVVTGISDGQYKEFSDKNSFLAPDALRAVGGSAKRIGFDADDATYTCAPYALEITIDEFERKKAGDDESMLESAKTRTVITQAYLSHERAVFAAVSGALTAASGKGVWSTATNDPIAEIDEQIEAIANNTGRMPNRIVMGIAAWAKLRSNAKVIERQPGATLIGLTTAQLSSMLLAPVEIRIGTLAYDTAKAGKTASKSNIVGSECYIFYADDNPTQYDPSFAKTFSATSGGVFDVRMYQQDPRTDVIAVDWTDCVKVTAAPAARRISVS